jgi:hypothetical protein
MVAEVLSLVLIFLLTCFVGSLLLHGGRRFKHVLPLPGVLGHPIPNPGQRSIAQASDGTECAPVIRFRKIHAVFERLISYEIFQGKGPERGKVRFEKESPDHPRRN